MLEFRGDDDHHRLRGITNCDPGGGRDADSRQYTVTTQRIQTSFIEPGSPWEHGFIESLNGCIRDELLNVELFDTLLEAQVLTERWRRHYNAVCPHSSLAYRPRGPEAVLSAMNFTPDLTWDLAPSMGQVSIDYSHDMQLLDAVDTFCDNPDTIVTKQ